MIEQVESIVIAFFVGAILTYFSTRWSTIFKKMGAVEYGIQALLRDRILQMHDYYSRKGRPIPQREVESAEQMYRAYKRLGGNGFLDQIEKEILEEMPHATN